MRHMEPKFEDREAFTVMGVTVHSEPDAVDFGALWQEEFTPHHEAIRGISADDAYYGVWFPPQADGIPDYVAGMAVPDEAPLPVGLIKRRVPASRYAVFECSVETIGATYQRIYETWLPSSSYERTPDGVDLEVYPPEDAVDVSPAVYIPVREKRSG